MKRGKKPVVLIVDDTPANIQVVGNILRGSIECDIMFALSASEAFEKINAVLPSLILLDVMMPGMDGYETCQTLRNTSRTSDIPVIFLTARMEPEDVVRGFESGGVDYVTKPFNPSELTARVRTHLDIKRHKDTITAQNEERKELLHILCHDLANPFSSIISALDFFQNNPVMSGDPEIRKEIEKDLLRSAQSGLELISMIRQFRSLEEKPVSLTLKKVPLKTAARESCNMLRHRFSIKNIKLELDVPDDIEVMAEPVSFMNSALNNILTNAIKFSFPGGVITIAARNLGAAVELSVTDRGIGMSEKLLADLFDISKQTSRNGTSGEKGTGFGMPLLKKFVSLYGGAVEIESKDIKKYPEGHGTKVTLRLAAAQAE